MSKQLGTAIAFSVMTMAAFALFITATPHGGFSSNANGAAGTLAAPFMFSQMRIR